MNENGINVLHLLQSNRYSGAENVVCQIIEYYKGDKRFNMCYSSKDGQIREILKQKGISFRGIRRVSFSEIKRVIKEYKPDVIHAHDRTVSLVASVVAGKIPVVVHMHVNNNRGIKLWLKNLLWTMFSFRYRHIFWVSQSSFDGFPFHRFLKKKSSVLYNVMNKESVLSRRDEAAVKDSFDAVYVGRLSYQKNPQRLLKVLHELCRILPTFTAAIVGTGEFEHEVKAYIDNNGLCGRIHYLGYLDNPLAVIANARLLIMTSRFEGTPMVALEAQILGIPIVSTPVDGMVAVVRDGENGYLSDDDAALVRRCYDVVTNQEVFDVLHEGSIRRSVEFSNIDSFCSVIEKKYRECVNNFEWR